jgi:pimeloyl-ACP methyl ester carboxylesterase
MSNDITPVRYGSIAVDGLNIAYREAGNPANPKLVLLHGFPASSHQYRDLIRELADRFHLIAPDYPGFGLSDTPDPATFPYTFDRISRIVERVLALKGFNRYGLFVQDYGGPVGFRLVESKPDALEWLIIQNSNAYEVGFTAAWDGLRNALWKTRSPETEEPLLGFLTRDTIKTIYLHGAKRPELVSPDSWESDVAFMQRPNAARLHLDLFYDYRTNVPLYPQWQAFLRERQPETIIFWGQDDIFFTREGGDAYLSDLPAAEMHRLDAGHFATEDHLDYIATHIRRFYSQSVAGSNGGANRTSGHTSGVRTAEQIA